MTVNIFIPCVVDQLYPQTAVNMVKVLEHFGVKVEYLTEQTCCGQLAYKNGYFDHAMELGDKFISLFNNGNYVVAPTVSCVVMVKKYYPKLFYNSSRHNDLKQLVPKTFEFSDFLYNVMGIQVIQATHNADICIHSSCAGLREYGKSDVPYKILSSIKGIKILDLPDSETCCGFGGTFSVKHHHISAAMAEDKLNNAISTGAQYLVGNEASCLMHLSTYARKQKLAIQPIHIADFLAMVLEL